ARAEKAAAADPDPRALMHVQRDRDIFAYTWETARKVYLESYRELNAYRIRGPIKIDGVFDEEDWKSADVMTGFICSPWVKQKMQVVQTLFRVVYEPENLYIAIDAMEPTPENMIATKIAPDGPHRKMGNALEIFFNYPDMSAEYYHYIINSVGSLIDARHGPSKRDITYNGEIEYASKILPDRWTLELRIPTANVGMKCFDGAAWLLNIARCRKVNEENAELSSWCSGHFHGIDNFGVIKFTPSRSNEVK
ncbi:MAG: hypothetical protein WCT05_15160, partial [Lentisphaeria bacterium]